MKNFKEYVEKRFLFEEAPGIGAPGALPMGGGPPGGGPPGLGGGGGPPPMGGMGGPPGGMPGMGGGPPPGGGGNMAGQKPLVINSLDIWEVLKKIFSIDSEEKKPEIVEKPTALKHLQS
jgi:hypothetical protein